MAEQQYGSCTAAERPYGDGHQIFNSHFVFGGRNFYLVSGFILAFFAAAAQNHTARFSVAEA